MGNVISIGMFEIIADDILIWGFGGSICFYLVHLGLLSFHLNRILLLENRCKSTQLFRIFLSYLFL